MYCSALHNVMHDAKCGMELVCHLNEALFFSHVQVVASCVMWYRKSFTLKFLRCSSVDDLSLSIFWHICITCM